MAPTALTGMATALAITDMAMGRVITDTAPVTPTADIRGTDTATIEQQSPEKSGLFRLFCTLLESNKLGALG
jgi:hypothetical protein